MVSRNPPTISKNISSDGTRSCYQKSTVWRLFVDGKVFFTPSYWVPFLNLFRRRISPWRTATLPPSPSTEVHKDSAYILTFKFFFRTYERNISATSPTTDGCLWAEIGEGVGRLEGCVRNDLNVYDQWEQGLRGLEQRNLTAVDLLCGAFHFVDGSPKNIWFNLAAVDLLFFEVIPRL